MKNSIASSYTVYTQVNTTTSRCRNFVILPLHKFIHNDDTAQDYDFARACRERGLQTVRALLLIEREIPGDIPGLDREIELILECLDFVEPAVEEVSDFKLQNVPKLVKTRLELLRRAKSFLDMKAMEEIGVDNYRPEARFM